MAEFYYTKMKFDGEEGYEQIQLSEGRIVIRQWLPDTQKIRETLKRWKAVEVTPEQLKDLVDVPVGIKAND